MESALAYFLCLLPLLSAFAVSPPKAGRVELEASVPLHDPASSSWVNVGTPSPDEIMELTAVVRVGRRNRDALERVFWAVSEPGHEQYGKHLTVSEVASVLNVPVQRAERVRLHFAMSGAIETKVSPTRDTVSIKLPVAAAELALNTTIREFRHRDDSQSRVLRAVDRYSLPAHLANDVIYVGELLQFPRLRSPVLQNLTGHGDWSNDCDTRRCKGLVTPGVLAKRYNLPSPSEQLANLSNSMAVAEFQLQYFRKKDLTKFGQSCHRDVQVASVQGGNIQLLPGVEAELDIEYIRSVAPSVPLTVIYSGSYSLLNWATTITGDDSSPLVHSVSYGNDENQQSSKEYMLSCNLAFMKAGAMGRSILFASGDQGVCGREGCGGLGGGYFKPDFPAASPYITAVGGTNFEGKGIGPESAWNNGGGGFSNTFGIPAYQASAVQAYKDSPDANLPPQRMWNDTGRGYPDVAALGGTKTPYCVRAGILGFQGVAGTSASSPVVAGVFALVNAKRLEAGKPPMGFLNPFIYKNPSAFQDVRSGRNDAGTRYGFSAVEGWDAATGHGTPDYERIAKAAMAIG